MSARKQHMKKKQPAKNEPIGLKQRAEHLGLNPATISVVLNEVPGRSIPQATRDRIKAAAKEFNYQPSLLARSLRNRRTRRIVTDDEKAIEHAEGDRRNSEEVHRSNRFSVITEKGKPALARLRISRLQIHP